MKTIGTSSLSAYNYRTVTVSVASLCHPGEVQISKYTVKLPYYRVSQAIEPINSWGSKVAGCQMDALALSPKAVAQK